MSVSPCLHGAGVARAVDVAPHGAAAGVALGAGRREAAAPRGVLRRALVEHQGSAVRRVGRRPEPEPYTPQLIVNTLCGIRWVVSDNKVRQTV